MIRQILQEKVRSAMSDDTEGINKLRKTLDQILTNIEKNEHESNLKEIEEEILEEYKRDLGVSRPKTKKMGLGQKLPRPNPQSIVSLEADGKTAKTLFLHDEWHILKLGEFRTFRFRLISIARELDLTGQLSDNLVYFFKICSWFMLPGKNPGSNVKNTRTSLNNMDYFKYFISLLRHHRRT
jgi:hypothetical protein